MPDSARTVPPSSASAIHHSTLASDVRRTQLRRMKIAALALLVAMVCGFITSHVMGGQGAWAWVRAFCEAATVGALADWFAVVALFRRPMGLPIPHTAIIPSNKDRIGDNLAVFVRDHFLDPDTLMEKLRVFDPAARLSRWLVRPKQAHALSDGARRVALQTLDMLDEQAVRGVIQEFVVKNLRRWDAAGTVGEILGLLTRDGRHQELLDAAMERLGGYLGEDDVKERASTLLVKFARKEWPRIIAAVDVVKSVDGIADNLADRLALALVQEVRDVLSEPDHPVRRDYEAWVLNYIERLKSDPALSAQVEDLKQRAIDHPKVQEYVQGLWDDIHAALRRDLSDEDSALARHLESALLALGRKLGEDPSLRDAINNHVLGSARRLTGRLRIGVTEHISRTVKNWDERHLVDELELSVGRDLQYIRFNGTLVGGLIGVALHALVLLVNR
ncbi:Predicted membrane protein [Achromobacter kerstersii]|nr:Predicted membrane protein [Achromobacter kerstersii]